MYDILDTESYMNIKSNEGDIISIPLFIARNSGYFRNIVNSTPFRRDQQPEVELETIDTETLVKIRDYLEHYQNKYPKSIEKPLEYCNFKECVDEWDYKYINEDDVNKIIQILNAAEFLKIPSLVDLAAAKLASFLKGKSPKELKENLNIPLDNFTPEDNQEIDDNIQWCVDNY